MNYRIRETLLKTTSLKESMIVADTNNIDIVTIFKVVSVVEKIEVHLKALKNGESYSLSSKDLISFPMCADPWFLVDEFQFIFNMSI